ncbi:alpha/beta fold hydrolase [Candidatus Saccharibacteria bacterium]|nr:alpha/beta fold hydrolase [Candidatus Saccharibacteria bacterium]
MFDDIIHRRIGSPYTLHVEKLHSPRRPRATVVLIHGIGSSTLMWHNLARDLPADIRVVAIDLLGFGKSPDPEWAKYDAPTQAKSLIKTLVLHRVPLGSIFVGHSLGALVIVEMARRIPRYPSRIMLISPPIYRPSRQKVVATQQEDVLRGIYKILQRYPKNTERALKLAKQYYVRRSGQLVAPVINVNSYLGTLESAIINQDTINHIADVRAPISILSGSRDPVVVRKNLVALKSASPRITYTVVKGGGHNVIGAMKVAAIEEIKALLC